LLLGAFGFAVGLVLVFSVRDHFPRAVELGVFEVVAMAAVTAVICLLASLLSIRAALRIDPQQALGG
jgi:putative ABC transport system permease protein